MQSDQRPRLRLYLDDAQAIDDLFRQALRVREHEALPEFLNFLVRFRRYSLFNAMLIRVQRPGALAVASRRPWLDYERRVAPDAVPIVILQPFGPVQFIYDVGDTLGPPLPTGAEWGPFAATVIPAKSGIYLYQCVMAFDPPLRCGRNDGFLGRRAFFSSLLDNRADALC